ncbi:MAG: major capsid protein [Betaproteobacteria bacterium]|nr:major capsid protein [Betaproteobacteria bacterium]MCL2886511.1 major capsid protein [Betaproteobacteria bacterium]
MPMTLEQIRLKQNPILTGLLLAQVAQGNLVAEILFPRLPFAVRSGMVPKLGNEAMQQYNLRRAPGAHTKRITVSYEGAVYTVEQHSVEVPIPREWIEEQQGAFSLGLPRNLDVSQIAMSTASSVLTLGYEVEAAALATDAGQYPSSNVLTLTGAAKWSASTGKPVDDIIGASDAIRAKTGRRPNTLIVSPNVLSALYRNEQIRAYFPTDRIGLPTLADLSTILRVPRIVEADAIWVDGQNVAHDVWGNVAILAYVPPVGGSMSLADPAWGFTSVLEGHPFAELPYYENTSKTWVYGATFERSANIATSAAGFLFVEPA